jgi:predicted PurR-regulated permease PerM
MNTATWQRLAFVGIAASAAVFLAGSAWQTLGVLGPVLGLFFGGWLLSCLLEPVVARVACRARVARPTAVLGTYIAVLAVVALVWIVTAPGVGSQVSRGITQLPSQVETATQRTIGAQSRLNDWLSEIGLPLHVDVVSNSSLANVAGQVLSRVESTDVVSSGVQAFGNLGMMLLLSVFFLLGGTQLAEQVIQAFGARAAPDIRFVLTTLHDVFEGFARAQLLQAVLFGAGVWACLAVAQVETAPLVAAAAGVLLIVPLVGAILAIALPVVATLLWNPSAAIAVGVALVLLEQLVLNVIGPRVMSRQLGLPPLLVLFGILAGGQVAGFWGALFGIPTLAALMACFDHFRPRWSGEPG